MTEFWDTRFRAEEYVYGETPNIFFERTLGDLNLTGKILFPAEGEGRNAVFAAKNGLDVTAFDLSVEGKNKALRLAEINNVDLEYLIGNLDEHNFQKESFDVIVLIFAHFTPNLRSQLHNSFSKLLKKDGILILEGFSKNNLRLNNTNGPKNLEMLFSTEMISSDFSELQTIALSEDLSEINEGNFHKGESSVVRYIGKKR